MYGKYKIILKTILFIIIFYMFDILNNNIDYFYMNAYLYMLISVFENIILGMLVAFIICDNLKPNSNARTNLLILVLFSIFAFAKPIMYTQIYVSIVGEAIKPIYNVVVYFQILSGIWLVLIILREIEIKKEKRATEIVNEQIKTK